MKSVSQSRSCEERARMYARRSIVANCNIKKGDIFTEQNIACKRPGTGLHPRFYFELIGKVAQRDIQDDDLLTAEDLKE